MGATCGETADRFSLPPLQPAAAGRHPDLPALRPTGLSPNARGVIASGDCDGAHGPGAGGDALAAVPAATSGKCAAAGDDLSTSQRAERRICAAGAGAGGQRYANPWL